MILNQSNWAQVFRGMLSRKVLSLVIFGSISIGLSVAIILFGFIQRERNTDHFHPESELIYRLLSNDPFERVEKMSSIQNEASAYMSSFPEVKNVCRVAELAWRGVPLKCNSNTIEEAMVVGVDSTFFNIFNFPFYQGNKEDAIRPNGIVITKSLAMKAFGKVDVLGEDILVLFDTLQTPFIVSGVLDEMQENTHFKFDALVPFTSFDSFLRVASTYISLQPESNANILADKLSSDAHMPSLIGEGKSIYFLRSLVEVYFDNEDIRPFEHARNPDLMVTSWLIIFLILFIAVFNFINLFVVSLFDRKKEFGIKKVLGASASDVRTNITVEVVVYLLLSLSIASVITLIAIPYFNQVFETNLDYSNLLNSTILISLLFLLLGLTIIISMVLNLYLNKVLPVSLLSDKKRVKFGFNKMFFVMQFVISMVLIFCSIVVMKQIRYIESKPLGFDRDVMVLKMPKEGIESDMVVLKKQLALQSMFRSDRISVTNGNPISGGWIVRYDLDNDGFYAPYSISGDEDIITTLGVQLIEGQQPVVLSKNEKIVNQKFIKHFNMDDPIGIPIPGSKEGKIAGVVSDFNVASLKEEIPLYMIGYSSSGNQILINYSGLEIASVISQVEKSWKEIFPNSHFRYTLLGDELSLKHKEDFYFSKIIIAFALISILISCFGLWALAQSNCQKKGKEIAVRKSLGASTQGIFLLLLYDFGKWIILSFFIAATIGYYTIQIWLQTFAYRTELNWPIFLFTAIVTGVIVLMAMGYQTVKASLVNPVMQLRDE